MRFDHSTKTAFAIACILLIGGRLGFGIAAHALNIYLQKEPVPMRRQFSSIPDTIGRWKKLGSDTVLDKAMIEELGTDKYMDRVYGLDGTSTKGRILVHTDYYTGMIDAVPHVPDRC